MTTAHDCYASPPVTIVTGASRGIGAAIAKALAEAGHRLVLVARDPARLAATAAELKTRGTVVQTVIADLREEAAAGHGRRRGRTTLRPPTAVVSNAARPVRARSRTRRTPSCARPSPCTSAPRWPSRAPACRP
jgi:NADP-dependent 3-hydroxy acid dehydrogenase YdfG